MKFDESKCEYGIMDIQGPLTKSDLRKIRSEIINAICVKIAGQTKTEYGDKLTVDHYTRYLHGLTLLEVPKDSNLLPEIGENIEYSIAYNLWMLDDGSEENWNIVDKNAWHIAEAFKTRK